ncbi:uncharacterized protein LOC128833768 [Malaclemys terrapin pileata]|uniref:uncharacterized protein LOC128833768 n=1 Tax=Malaclemys terrapin pileata TaxID=2991368 RepID=UPI0023A8F504|nr:uncharacterized protein LOC128833768 [Malaclemys terrapin pileata]
MQTVAPGQSPIHAGSMMSCMQFWGVAPTTTPSLSVDTCKRGVSRNRDEEFENEEDEEEEKVEDSTQQASKESLLPSSQELFITLEPIPSQLSQGGLPDHEAGEGTSAPNVSTLPLSSPSQRLAQIRRQKKFSFFFPSRKISEIFSELMQSSCTERAQQNVWRQTMAESRKALNERDERREEHAERRQDAMLSLMREETDMLRCLLTLLQEVELQFEGLPPQRDQNRSVQRKNERPPPKSSD